MKELDCFSGMRSTLETAFSASEVLFEKTRMAIVHLDAKGSYLHVNETFLKFIGYTREEMKSMNFWEIIHPKYIKQTRNLFAKLIDGEIDYFTHEKYCICKDGSLHWVEMNCTCIRDERERLPSVVAVIIDRTQQKQAEEKLNKYAAELEDLYENAPCGYHSLGKDGTIIHMNSTELSWLGYSPTEVIGKMKFIDLIPPEERYKFHRGFPALKRQERLPAIEGKLTRKDGEIFPVIISVNAIYDENGNYIMDRASVLNNTERKRMENDLAENEAIYHSLFENASIGMVHTTFEGQFLRVNRAFAMMLGYESPEEVISTITDVATQVHCSLENRLEFIAALEETDWYYSEQSYLRKDGSILIGKLAIRKVFRQNGTIAYFEGLIEDITEQKYAEEALIKRESELRIKEEKLEEARTTFKFLLETMEINEEKLTEKFLINIKEQVLPYLNNLKETSLNDIQRGLVIMTETALEDIASPFVQKLATSCLNLTQKEIQIAALIREGKTSKEIGRLINLSQRAIDFYRGKIRKKLGIKNKQCNLNTLLNAYDVSSTLNKGRRQLTCKRTDLS